MRVKSFTSYSPSGSITGLGLQVTSGHCNHPSTERQSSQRPVGRGTETSMCAIACIIGTGPVKSSNYTTRHLGQYCCRYLLSSRMFIRSRAFGTRISVCASVRLTAHAQRVPLPAGPLLKQATSFMIYLQLASLGLSNVIPGHTGSYLLSTSLAYKTTSCNHRHTRPPPRINRGPSMRRICQRKYPRPQRRFLDALPTSGDTCPGFLVWDPASAVQQALPCDGRTDPTTSFRRPCDCCTSPPVG